MGKEEFLKILGEYDEIALWQLCDILNKDDNELGGWIPEDTFRLAVALRLSSWVCFSAYDLLHPNPKSNTQRSVQGQMLAAKAIQRSLKARGLIETRRLSGRFNGRVGLRPTHHIPKPAFRPGLESFYREEIQAKQRSERAKRGAATRRAKQEAQQEETERLKALAVLDELALRRT